MTKQFEVRNQAVWGTSDRSLAPSEFCCLNAACGEVSAGLELQDGDEVRRVDEGLVLGPLFGGEKPLVRTGEDSSLGTSRLFR
jgi:hypothetical protein